jgi:hypothetical protein
MDKYQCEQCGMSIKAMQCGQCGQTLETDVIKTKEGEVKVSKCPQGCGMIKSPLCCGRDMQAE